MFGKLLNAIPAGGDISAISSPKSSRGEFSAEGGSGNVGGGNGRSIVQFSPTDFKQIAVSLLQSLIQYNTIEPQLE
jgi:hypothetical protein